MPYQQYKIANFIEYLGELQGLIKLCKNDGEIVIIGDTNCHFVSEVNIRCTGKTTPQARLMLKMTCKNNIDIIDIGSLGTGPTYIFRRDKVGRSYMDHVLTLKRLYPHVKSCNVANECLGNTSDHQVIAVSIECGWHNPRTTHQMTPRVEWKKLDRDDIDIKYTTPIQEEFDMINTILDNQEQCQYSNRKDETEQLLMAVIGCIISVSK